MGIEDRVREVIETDGRGQGAFAIAIGIDPSKMSKSLAGQRRFTSLELAQIAEVGRTTVDYLVSGEPSPLAMAARKNQDTPVDRATRVGARLAELRGTANRLNYRQDYELLPTEGLKGREVDKALTMADRAIRHLADRALNPTTDDLATEIELAFGFDLAVKPLGKQFDGLSVSGPDLRLIVASPSSNPGRYRFTLAHELGHLLFADDQGLHLDKDIFDVRPGKDLSELRANSFASAFLMPAYAVRSRAEQPLGRAEFCQLAMDLAVTPSALAIRLKQLDLGKVVPQYIPTMEQAAQVTGELDRYAHLVELSSQVRPPRLLARHLLRAYLDKATTIRPFAEVMDLEPDVARQHGHDKSEVTWS